MFFNSKNITRMYSYNCHKNILLPGNVPEEQFWLLIDISPIHSEKVIVALFDYFVVGKSRKDICDLHHINNGYLSTSISRLNRINHTAKKLARYYSDK